MRSPSSLSSLPQLARLTVLATLLAGCPEQDDVSTSTSATESSATMGDASGDPSTSSPSTSTMDPEDPEDPTSTFTTTAADDVAVGGDPRVAADVDTAVIDVDGRRLPDGHASYPYQTLVRPGIARR